MAQAKSQSPLVGILSLILLTFLFFKYIYVGTPGVLFEVRDNHVVFHANWTTDIHKIHSSLDNLQKVLQRPQIQNVWLSFSLSHGINQDTIDHVIPASFTSETKNIRINLANCPIGDKGAERVFDSLPAGLTHLDLSLDSIDSSSKIGAIAGNALSKLTELRELRLSFILSGLQNQGLIGLLSGIKQLKHLRKVGLVLMANELNIGSTPHIQQFLSNLANIEILQLNLFSNKFEHEGIAGIAQGLSNLTTLKDLDLDLYFNNLTEVGTQHVAKAVKNLVQLERLRLNLDFNYIKNEGSKAVGEALKNLQKLTNLNLGVASKNFGYLGFKEIIKGVESLENLHTLALRCGVNRVGVNGAELTGNMLSKLTKLQNLDLGFVENYIGDEGAVILTKAVIAIPLLKRLNYDISFNDIKGYGGIEALKLLSGINLEYLRVSLSNNEFRDPEAKLIARQLDANLKSHEEFTFQFLNTAITEKGKEAVEKVFEAHQQDLIINNIELAKEQKSQL